MAQIRTKQRGVIRLATSVLVAAMGTLLGATGCASDDVSTGSGGEETLDRVRQGLACDKFNPCPEDSECGDWTCSLTPSGNMCTVAKPGANGDPCKGVVSGQAGTCVNSVCCTGCITKNKVTGEYVCHPGTDLTFCGGDGVACDNCNGGDTCQVYQCVPEKRVCDATPVGEGAPCTDNNGACHNGSCCAGCIDGNDTCVTGTSVTACGLSSVNDKLVQCANCDDGNVCNNDSCQNGVCAAPTPKAGSCADANKCNGDEQCGNGQCQDAPNLNCNDNNPCTVDSCDPATGCVNTPKEAGVSCDDATVCNGVSKCELDPQGKIFCKAGTAPDCDDNNICTTDSCDAVTGCKHAPNTLDCSDNDLCTLVDKCENGKCVGAGKPECDDNEPCTTDDCAPAKGCTHVPVADNTGCNDENGCTSNDVCTAGKCAGANNPCVDDGNPCTKVACSVANGCSYPDEDNGTPCFKNRCVQNNTCQNGVCDAGDPVDCDDNNPCTTDSCDPAAGCKHTNVDGGDCSDNDQCTTGDKCKAGACVGTAKVCAALDDCHVAGTCDSSNGACSDPRADDDIECDDGKGTCQSGKCEPLPGAGGAGAGGEPGAGGMEPGGGTSGTGGSAVNPAGGEPTMGLAGEGNEPGAGGTPGEPGKGGSTNGGTATDNGGEEGIDPERVFVRNPGGCSCNVPSSSNSGSGLLLAGMAALVAVSRRRQARARRAT